MDEETASLTMSARSSAALPSWRSSPAIPRA